MRKILIVDDDVYILKVLKEMLESHNLTVYTNSTGDNVIEQILQHEPHIIILDVNLNHNNGFDILRNIRRNLLISFIPVIMLTGIVNQNSQIEGLTSGADDYVTKPFGLNVLYARILAIFRRLLVKTRTKYDQINLLHHMVNIYIKRNYQIYTKFLDRYEDHPPQWQGFVPDLIISKKNKTRALVFESAQSILEEPFIKRLEQMSLLNKDDIEPILVVRSKETLKQCNEIINEYRFNINVKKINRNQ